VDGSDHSAATVAFDKAVHLVEMLLAKRSLAHLSGSHTKRNQLLKTRFVTIWKDYRPLYAFSRQARYWCLAVRPSHIPPIIKRLRHLEGTIGKLMRVK
jgi:hypothetical protein